MNIKNIRLINFRNYLNLDLELNSKINIFIGKNAQGKTNLLEAIYVCARARSFRTNSQREMINFEKSQAYLAANLNIDDYKRLVEIKLDRRGSKSIKINKNLVDSTKDLNSGLNVVVFSPDDLSLVKEGPYIRRDFLDLEISQIKPVYSYNIKRYKKILYQRNNILKSHRPYKEKEDLLDIFDRQLVATGAVVIKERAEYIKDLSNLASQVHKKVSNSNELLELEYLTNVELGEDLREIEINYYRKLKENLKQDIETTNTSIGPHRDDMKVLINKKDARVYGSQGQQRTSVLSIKLSEVELIKQERGSYPVLLLDDVFSELDRERRSYLIKSLKNIQTIITVTDSLNLDEMKDMDKSVFYVDDGKLKKEDRYDS